MRASLAVTETLYQYFYFRLADSGADATIMPRQALADARGSERGLVSTWGGGAVVLTGAHTGFMTVTLEAWDDAPPAASAEWEEVTTAVYTSTTGAVHVLREWESKRPEESEQAEILALPAGGGTYQMRVHARGRAAGRAVAGSANHVETMLIQFWPMR